MEGLLGLEYAVLFSTIFKNLGSRELLSLRTLPSREGSGDWGGICPPRLAALGLWGHPGLTFAASRGTRTRSADVFNPSQGRPWRPAAWHTHLHWGKDLAARVSADAGRAATRPKERGN